MDGVINKNIIYEENEKKTMDNMKKLLGIVVLK